MAKFRCRIIPAVIARFTNDTVIDEKCTLCYIDVTCDEPHRLFQCIFFENERLLFLCRNGFRNFKWIFICDLMENPSANIPSTLSKFMSITI